MEAHQGGRVADAEAAYREVLQERPADPDALNFLGMLCCQTDRAEEGAALLRRSTEADPSNPHAWINLGNVLVKLDKDEEALGAFTKATELAPDLPIAWFNVGICLGRCKRAHEAASALHKVLKLEPGYLPAYDFLSRLLHRLGSYAEAAELYREWLTHDPDNPIALHMLAATGGAEIPTKASTAYIERLFDNFASGFDANLESLNYRAPQWVAERLGRLVAADAALQILDAGCGTGLCGPLLKPLAARLVGVDLSAKMLEKAEARRTYDELVVGELAQFMRGRPARFDAVVSADTLIYFGALEEPLSAARLCLRPGGILAFTLERLDPASSGAAFRLETHGRYSHSETYLRGALEQAGFVGVELETRVLRTERGREVAGHVVTARTAAP